MKFLKGRFLIAALALSVASAGIYGYGSASAYKVSADLSGRKVSFHYEAHLHYDESVFIGFDISGSPYKFEDTVYNRQILAESIKVWKAQGSYAGSGQETYVETNDFEVSKDEIIVSPDKKSIYFHWSADYITNDHTRRNLAYHIVDLETEGTGVNGYAFSLKEGYDLSRLRLTLDEGVESLGVSGNIYEGVVRVESNYDAVFGGLVYELTQRNTFKYEEKVPLTIPKMSIGNSAFKVGEKIDYSRLISGVNDKFSVVDDSSVDTTSAGRKEGMVKFEYEGDDFIYSLDVPVVVNVEATPEVKNESINDASIPQAPNTGFQNNAGVRLIALSLLGLSTWFVIKRK